MESFINLCVSDILQKHSQNMANTTVVFPSKRAMVFFKKSMREQISQPIFLPRMTTIQDFCISRQSSTIPDDFTLIFLLYQSYKTIALSNESFEEFYPWGQMLLSDFDDIDKYKINADDLFTNIADIKEIESAFSYLNEEQIAMISRFWDTTKISQETDENDVRRNFVKFWNLLPAIYSDYKNKLQAQNFCYEGMAIRSVAEASIEDKDEFFGNDIYIFLGFNALSKCENSIFEFLSNRKQAFFYWDYDTYYEDDNSHEAGIFIRKNIKNFPNELAQDKFSNFLSDKNINIIQVPNEISQAKLCGDLLHKQKSLDDTAIILADEKLIVPLIKSIPNEIKYNITLGYPIRSSAAYTLFESILNLCENKKNDKIYYKDILRICENPLIPIEFQQYAKQLQKTINTERKITLSTQECSEISQNNLDYLLNIDCSLDKYIENLIKSILAIYEKSNLSDIDKSIFYTIYTELSALQTIVNKQDITFDKITFVNKLLKQTIQGKTIAIEGQPLEGLQVMGILETRMLDFKNIIMTSVMDGNLPKTSTGSSFIPYNLRVAFGMPTIKEQSAMYSYYFYRLIQRCENLTLLYCENSGENKCEKSRFILQLLYESPFKNLSASENNPTKIYNGITIQERSYNIVPTIINGQQIEKSSPEFFGYIDKIKNDKYLSPTALSKFIQCQKQFYFSQIKGLKKPEELDELPKPFDIGNYFHDTMEKIYTPFVKSGKIIDETVIDEILSDEKTIQSHIAKVMKDNKAPQNIANPSSKEFQATFKQIQKFLEFEKKNPFKLIALEENNLLQLDNDIKIGGRIDRLDFCQNTYRIIDYKTGKCTPEKLPQKLNVKDLENLFTSNGIQKEAFQICMYAYILKTLNKDNKYQPNLYFIQAINNKAKTTLNIEGNDVMQFDLDLYDAFKEHLVDTINELINPDGYFKETENEKLCKYCDFKEFCRK